MTSPALTAADIALLDQAHAAANADLDEMVSEQQPRVDVYGTTLAAAGLAAELQTAGHDVDYLAGLAALAITRLAEPEGGAA